MQIVYDETQGPRFVVSTGPDSPGGANELRVTWVLGQGVIRALRQLVETGGYQDDDDVVYVLELGLPYGVVRHLFPAAN